MEDLVQPIKEFVALHQGWAAAVIFIATFGESFAFVGLLFPGTSLLIAVGTLMSDGTLSPGPVIVAAALGAVLGDAISYWLGRRYGGAIARIWPFSRNPDLLPYGIDFFARHGGKSVFLGRFFGPVRAVIPLAAGILHMLPGRFWFANIASAAVWAPMLLFAGDVMGQIGDRLLGPGNTVALVFGGLTLFGIGAVLWAAFRSSRSKT